MDDQDTWIWIGVGERQAINLRHVTGIVLVEGEPPTAHLALAGRDGAGSVTVEGAEAAAVRAYLHRVARHLEDLAAG